MPDKMEGGGSPLGPPTTATAFNRPFELLLYAVAPLATLITAPILARTLGPEGRGEYGVALAVTTFALTISAWGQAETYMVEARSGRFHYGQQTRIALIGGLFSTALAVVLLVLLGIPLLTAVLAAIWIPVLNQSNLWRAVAVSSGRLRAPALNNAVGPIARAGVLALLASFSLVTVEDAVTVTQAALAVGAVVTVGLTARRLQRGFERIAVPVHTLLRQGSAIITFDVFNAFALRSDLIVLQIFASPHQVGLYAAPASLTASALALSTPFKSRMQAAAVARRSTASIAREALPVLVLAVIGAFALLLLAPWLVELFFGPGFGGSVIVLRLLGFATIPLLLLDLAQGILVVLAERRALILVGALDATVVVVSLAILSPVAGSVGAAIACIIGYTIAATLGWAVALRALGHRPGTAAA